MTTDRQFARFNSGRSLATGAQDASTLTQRRVPDGGMCLSAFLVIIQRGAPGRVLLGKLNPRARWDHIGALDPERVEAHSRGWMIPSCHLMLRESPGDAAKRVAKEQLELEGLALTGPAVLSEAYTPRRFPDLPDHWDLEFVFRGELPPEALPRPRAWEELAFVQVGLTERSQMARSHEDVLESLGFRFAD